MTRLQFVGTYNERCNFGFRNCFNCKYYDYHNSYNGKGCLKMVENNVENAGVGSNIFVCDLHEFKVEYKKFNDDKSWFATI
jgi:hypothetical protein